MKTVFICESLNIRLEGTDRRPYAVNERITLKHRGRWLPMIVEAIHEHGDVREIILSLNHRSSSATLHQNVRALERTEDREWLDRFWRRVEGGRGPVRW